MNAVRVKKIKILSVMLTVILSLACLMPVTAFAAPGDMTIEYRYIAGESVDVPTNITYLNREYRLVSQAAPVLESTLPTTRTYTYRSDGALSEEDLKLIASIPGLSVEEHREELQREVEKVITVKNLSSNDVDELADKAPATMPCENGTGTMQRSGIEFKVAGTDGRGLPSGYEATVKYRGLETYVGDVYYLVEATYQTTVQESTVDQYVIIATYEPVNQQQVTDPVTTPGQDTVPVEPVVPQTTPTEQIPDETVPQAPGPEKDETVTAATTIDDEDVPLAAPNDNSSDSNSLQWIITGIAVVLIGGGLLIFFLIRKNKKEKTNL